MKNQALFSSKDESKKIKMSSAATLRVKQIIWIEKLFVIQCMPIYICQTYVSHFGIL